MATALAALMAVVLVSFAAADGPVSVGIVSVTPLPDGSTQVVLEVTDSGRPLTDIGLASVAVNEDGMAAQVGDIKTVVEADTSLAAVVAIDVSGSMAGAKLANATSAASQLIADLGPSDQVGVISFADAVTISAPLAANRTAAAGVLQALQAKGNTALYDAVAQASAMVNGSTLTRRAVILLSDGEDFGAVSKVTRDASLEKARSAGAVFYVIAAGSDADKSFLHDLADATRGRYFEAQSATDIPAVYASLEQLLRSQVVLTYRPPEAGSGGSHRLTVTVNRNGASASASAGVIRAVAPAPATETPPPATVTATQVTAAAKTESSSGSSSPGYLLLVIPLALVAGVGAFILARRHSGRVATPEPARLSTQPVPVEGPKLSERPRARLESAAGVVPIGSAPVTIGSAATSDLVLPGLAGEHARLWWRDGSAMLHSLDARHPVLVNGEAAEWATLSDGDELGIGETGLTYRLVPNGEHAEAAPAGTERQ